MTLKTVSTSLRVPNLTGENSFRSVIARTVLTLASFTFLLNGQGIEQRLFFYQQDSGRGVSDVVVGNQLRDLQSGALRRGWTSIAFTAGQMLFYDSKSGAGVYTVERPDGMFEDKTVVRWGSGWTHVLLQNSFVLLYNSASGLANISSNGQSAPTPQAMAKGWTHIVDISTGVLFYNAATGGAAIGRLRTDGQRSQYEETRGYAPGSIATGWTHIVPLDTGVLFYRISDGHAVISDLDSAGGLRDRPGTAGQMAPGWSHIVHFNGHLLFYNQTTGAGVLGKLAIGGGAPTQAGWLQQETALSGFATGWTHIVPYLYVPASLTTTPPNVTGGLERSQPGALIHETPRQARCREYAQSAVKDFDAMNKFSRCKVPADARWNANFEGHRDWCLSVPQNQVQSEQTARTDHLIHCGARGLY